MWPQREIWALCHALTRHNRIVLICHLTMRPLKKLSRGVWLVLICCVYLSRATIFDHTELAEYLISLVNKAHTRTHAPSVMHRKFLTSKNWIKETKTAFLPRKILQLFKLNGTSTNFCSLLLTGYAAPFFISFSDLVLQRLYYVRHARRTICDLKHLFAQRSTARADHLSPAVTLDRPFKKNCVAKGEKKKQKWGPSCSPINSFYWQTHNKLVHAEGVCRKHWNHSVSAL